MKSRQLRYTESGHLFISPRDDLDWLVDAMLYTGYSEEFCIALEFDPPFVADLMAAGFLVMSIDFKAPEQVRYALLPKLHLERSLLFWEDLHETKTIKRLLPRYELRFNTDFDYILEHCAEVHGEDWLTPPLRRCLTALKTAPQRAAPQNRRKAWPVQAVSFGVYREGKLLAGEFGIICGRVYTSYSGYHEEDSSGTAQMILTARFLEAQGFDFWDLGMPLEYKDQLGARNVKPGDFVALFRGALVPKKNHDTMIYDPG
jgi:Leu/Phe-tRNA-protein transferase